MNNLNKFQNWKIYWIFSALIILTILVLFLLFNIELKKSIDGILEVDEQKNFIIGFQNSNIQQVSGSKSIYLNLENKIYLLENPQFYAIGNNKYALSFDNDELYDLLKSQSIYNVKVFLDNQKLFNFIFNI